jgi:hypothetical protein
MTTLSPKSWLLPALLLCLVSASFAVDRSHTNYEKRNSGVTTSRMPEGGSSMTYLRGAGITCLAAMFLRSRNMNRPVRAK